MVRIPKTNIGQKQSNGNVEEEEEEEEVMDLCDNKIEYKTKEEKTTKPGPRAVAELRGFWTKTKMFGNFRGMEVTDQSKPLVGNEPKAKDVVDWLCLHGYDGEAVTKQNFQDADYYCVSGGIAVVASFRIWKALLRHVPRELKHLVSPAIIKGSRLTFCLVHLSANVPADVFLLTKTLEMEKKRDKDAFDRWILSEFCKQHDGLREYFLAGKMSKKAAKKWLLNESSGPDVVAASENGSIPAQVDQEILDAQTWLATTPDINLDGVVLPTVKETQTDCSFTQSTRVMTGAGKKPRPEVQEILDALASVAVPSGKGSKFPCRDHQVLIDAAGEVEYEEGVVYHNRFKRLRSEHDDTKSSDDEDDDGYLMPLEPLSVEGDVPRKRQTLSPSMRILYGMV